MIIAWRPQSFDDTFVPPHWLNADDTLSLLIVVVVVAAVGRQAVVFVWWFGCDCWAGVNVDLAMAATSP